jgi:histidine triad (HIT) family protein
VRRAGLRAVFFRVARSGRLGGLLRLGFRTMNFVIPVNRLRETATLLAFMHPSPVYPVHILLVPKRAYASLVDVPKDDCALWSDLLKTVQSLVGELGLEEGGYRLIINGGAYQDVPMLHFHLVSGQPVKGER